MLYSRISQSRKLMDFLFFFLIVGLGGNKLISEIYKQFYRNGLIRDLPARWSSFGKFLNGFKTFKKSSIMLKNLWNKSISAEITDKKFAKVLTLIEQINLILVYFKISTICFHNLISFPFLVSFFHCTSQV